MPARHDLTWEPATKRWKKIYKGKAYTVSCRKLGVLPTKEASYQAANVWWRERLAELEVQGPQHPHQAILDHLDRRIDWARRHGLERIAQDAVDGKYMVESSFDHEVADVMPFLEANTGDVESWAGVIGDDTPQDKTVSGQVKAWLASLEARVEAGDFSPDHYDNIIDVIAKFEAFFGGRRPIGEVDEATLERYHLHLLAKIKERRRDPKAGMAPEYARKVFRITKQFIKYCWGKRLLELPRNFNNRFSFGAAAKAVQTMAIEEFRGLHEAATGQTRLHLLLMANCGFYPVDISDLRDDEVDWVKGRIIRKRSKTAEHEDVPTVDFKLWPETFDLLKRYRSGAERALLTKTGQPWVHNRRVEGKLVSCNSVESNYTNLKRKVSQASKNKGLPAFTKSLSLIRKTSASLIGSESGYVSFVPHFLGHSPRTVADKHYHAPAKELFDEIVTWLGRKYGLVE